MPFALGLPLIDDNIKKNNLPVYFAGMFLIRMVGPILGFQIGTVLQKYYYRFEQPYGLTPVDPEWIGRWWMGFLIVGAALLLPSLALFFFPTPKAGSPLNFIDKNVRKNSKGHVIMPKGIKSKAADFFKTIGSVLRQPVYFGSLIGRICDVFAFKGFYVFLPKYIELQFGLPQYKISMYMQPVGIAAVAIGVFLGTVAMRVFKLEGRRAAGFVAVCSGVATFLSFVNVFIGCNSTMTALGQNLDSKISLNYSCMSDCGCAQMPMFPVCDTAGNVFYSPCHAGCPLTPNEIAKFVNPNSTVPGKVFHNCTCVETVDGQASRQFCSTEECDQMALVYFLFMALWWMIGSLGFTAESLIILRSVPPVHRSVSLGFTGFLVSLFATLPSPIFWGLIFDQFCIKWDQKCKNTKGYCSIYNATELRWWLHILYSSIKFTALLADIFVFYHAKGLKLAEEEKDIHNVDSASKIKLHSTEYPVQPLVKQKEMCVKNLK
uniref:Solute carrier organic anion transporter family member n=1 Tax=Panagrolaimus davidi TaxID=227884 RepID=A0A914QYJ1_9BILA